MHGKKGISPIIATILLIAFAVALGAMIMNWSSNLVAGGAQEQACGNVKFSIRTPMCFEDNKIKVDVANVGEQKIGALVLRINSPELDQDIQVKNSGLEPGEVFSKRVPSVLPDGAVISLLTMVGEELEVCEEPKHTVMDLPTCG